MRAECRKDDFIMKKVFICSPFRGNIEANTKKAKFYATILARAGCIPIAPHLYFPQFLDENSLTERMTGIEMGLELMDECDEVRVYGFNITDGMKFELDHARQKGIPVRLYDGDMDVVNIRTLPIDERATDDYRRAIKGLRLMK